MWKEAVVAHFKVLSQNFPGGTEETTKYLSGQPVSGYELGTPQYEAGVVSTQR
jgi:hypothetical protein